MAERELRFRITARDDASGVMRTMQTQWRQFQDDVGRVQRVLGTVRDVYNATIGELQTYGREVRDLSIVTGQNAEETSRLLQVMDDFEISAGDVSMASRAMRDSGLSPNIETLALLSDQFRDIQDPAKRADFLMDNFGRTGQRFAIAMQQGGDALRGMGAAVEEGLIINDQQLAQLEELRLSQDQLNDNWTALKNQIAMEVLPILISWTNEVIRNTNATRDNIDPTEELGRRFGGVTGYLSAMEPPTRAAATALRDLDSAADFAAGGMAGLGGGITDAGASAISSLPALQGITQEMITQAVMADQNAQAMGRVRDAIASLQDRHVTVTVETVRIETLRLAGGIQGTWRGAGGAGHAGVDVRASGGPLSRVSLVGEAGPELIVNGVVIPAEDTRRLLALGLMPEEKFQKGGTKTGTYYKSPGTTAAGAGLSASWLTSALAGQSTAAAIAGGGAAFLGAGLAPSAESAADISAAAAQEAAATTATQIPGAVAQATADANMATARIQTTAAAEMVASNRALLRELQTLRRDLPRVFRDSVSRLVD